MNFKTITVDGITYNVDNIGYEYAQLDGDSAGRSEDGTMYRDVIGLTNKIYCDFINYRSGNELSSLLHLLEKTSCNLTYYDPKEQTRITKNMYVVGDQINVINVNGVLMAEKFQIRFIQMNTDNI